MEKTRKFHGLPKAADFRASTMQLWLSPRFAAIFQEQLVMTLSKVVGDAGAKTATQLSHRTPMSTFEVGGMAIHCRANTIAQ